MENTAFLNVDLELESKQDLAPLLAALDSKTVVLHTRKAGGVFHASLELYEQRYSRSAESCLRRFAQLIARLPASARRRWDRVTARRFNVGIQAERSALALTFATTITQRTLREIAALGGQLVVTVHPPA